jgi:hypothetical protein
MENSQGSAPATREAPAIPATENYQRPFSPASFDATDHDEADSEIEAAFKWRLIGLRRLPRHQRALALRAAREWRAQALKALKERRAIERSARYRLWQLSRPAPRPSG